jgi:hypothetical protein
MIPEFLLSRLAGPIASGVAVLLLAALVYVGLDSLSKNRTIGLLRDEIHNPKTGFIAQVTAAQADLAQCRSNRLTLEESTERQNEAVDALRRKSEAQNAELDQLSRDYALRLGRANALIASMKSMPRSGDVCKDAEHLIREVAK